MDRELQLDRLKALRIGLKHYAESVNHLIDELEAEPPRYRSREERASRLRAISRRYLTDLTAMHIQAAGEVKDLPLYLADQSAAVVDAVLSDTAGFYIKNNKSLGDW